MKLLTKKCKTCNKLVIKPYTRSVKDFTQRAKYCSKECRYKSMVGRIPWNKGLEGIHLSPKTEFKKNHKTWNKGLSSPYIAELNVNWKGDKVGYHGIHKWVVRWKGKPQICENCGKNGNKQRMHWANIDHKYRRVLDDYIRLCPQCHADYDKKYN